MIIDLILDRKADDADIAAGYTHRRTWDGKVEKIEYNARKFYHAVSGYVDGCGGYYAERIARAMDNGTEQDVKNELYSYIIENDYNKEICSYISSVKWLN